MNSEPAGFDRDALMSALRTWDLSVSTLTYLPVGAGSHHYLALDSDGRRWFVTVDELITKLFGMSGPTFMPWLDVDLDRGPPGLTPPRRSTPDPLTDVAVITDSAVVDQPLLCTFGRPGPIWRYPPDQPQSIRSARASNAQAGRLAPLVVIAEVHQHGLGHLYRLPTIGVDDSLVEISLGKSSAKFPVALNMPIDLRPLCGGVPALQPAFGGFWGSDEPDRPNG